MRSTTGLTLVELVVVLSVLAALSGLLIPLFTGTLQDANEVSTERSLVQIRDAAMQYWLDTKHITLDGVTTVATEANRFDIDWLFASPVTGDTTWGFSANTRIGWRGPYISGSTGDIAVSSSPFLIDAWNNEIRIQDVDSTAALRDLRIVSGGPDGVIAIPASTATSALTSADVGDDIYVSLYVR